MFTVISIHRDHFRPRPCANDAIYFPLPQRNFCSAPNWRTENFDAAKENHRCARKRLDTFFGSVRFDSEASIPVSCANRFYWFIVAETSNRYPLYSRYSSQLSKWLPVRSNKNSMASSSKNKQTTALIPIWHRQFRRYQIQMRKAQMNTSYPYCRLREGIQWAESYNNSIEK